MQFKFQLLNFIFYQWINLTEIKSLSLWTASVFLKGVQCPHCFMWWGRKDFEYLHQSCYLLLFSVQIQYRYRAEIKIFVFWSLKLLSYFFFPAGVLWPALNQATVDSPSSVLPPPPLASPIPAPWFPGSATTAEKQMDVMAGPSPVAADCNTAYSTGNCAKKPHPKKPFIDSKVAVWILHLVVLIFVRSNSLSLNFNPFS